MRVECPQGACLNTSLIYIPVLCYKTFAKASGGTQNRPMRNPLTRVISPIRLFLAISLIGSVPQTVQAQEFFEIDLCDLEGADPNIKDMLGRNLLHIAVNSAYAPEVEIVLRYDPDLEAVNRYVQTPMMIAKYRNIRSSERALLAAGAKEWEPHFTDIDDELIYAMHRREQNKVLKLVESGANPNIDDITGRPLAFRVAKTADIDFLKRMIELGYSCAQRLQ